MLTHGIIHQYVNWTALGQPLVDEPLDPPPMRTPESYFRHRVRWGNYLRDPAGACDEK